MMLRCLCNPDAASGHFEALFRDKNQRLRRQDVQLRRLGCKTRNIVIADSVYLS